MKIAFITDIHLDIGGKKPQEVDVRQNFLNALAFLPQIKPNCLVIGGDICYSTGDQHIYKWAREQLDKLPYPYYVISGNHDDSTLLAEVFNRTNHLHGDELYYALPLEGRPTLFLDTAKGGLSASQWAWLQKYMAALRDNNVLVFMHHPPVLADVTFMDQHYSFRQTDQFLELIKGLPCHVTVVCGHYHVDKIVQRGNLLVLLSPSTFMQLKQDTPNMVVDHYRIGIREINLTNHGTNSTVYYL